jgi:hypothetical protein
MLNQRSSKYVALFFVLARLAIGSTCANAADEATAVRETGQIKIKQLKETSGIAASRKNPDILWVHNDGPTRFVFAVHTSGKLAALVTFPVETVDFEDIALGPGPKAGIDYIYVGDIGDNNSERREIRVMRFAEPQMSEAHNGQIEVETVEVFRLTYPDKAHNAEALIVDPSNGDIFIVTKESRNAGLYTCPASRLEDKAVAKLKFVGTLGFSRVSGGAIARDGSRIILRREDQGWLWNRGRRQSVVETLQTPPQKIPVRGDRQGRNGEAVSFSADGRSYFTVSEGKNPVIYEFQTPATSSDAGH